MDPPYPIRPSLFPSPPMSPPYVSSIPYRITSESHSGSIPPLPVRFGCNLILFWGKFTQFWFISTHWEHRAVTPKQEPLMVLQAPRAAA